MNERCPTCDKREHMRLVQMKGREAARNGWTRAQNPQTHELERQYWEYGWIEESFLREIEEHRALLEFSGVQLFRLFETLNNMVDGGRISPGVRDELVSAIETTASKLEKKLRGD